jgi:hypothetical protein
MRAIFSFPVVLGALLVLLTMFTIRSRFSDPDTWWHLKMGELIWNTHSIPSVDLFSFTAYGHPLVAQEWLSELMLYGVWRAGGYTGLMLWFCIVTSLLIIAAYVLCTLYSGNCKVAFLGGVTVWLFSTIGLAIRPHLIGYLLLICELIVLHLGRRRSVRWLWALPPLFALWVNFHSSFFFGLVVLGVVLSLSFVEFESGLLASERWPREERRMLAIASGLSVAALLLNPIGPKLLWYPLDTMFSQNVGRALVQEWQPLEFSDFRWIAQVGLAGAIILVPLIRITRLYVLELTFLALGLYLSLPHRRMLFLFGILAAPVISRLFAQAWDRYNPQRDNSTAAAVTLAFVVGVIALSFPSRRMLDQEVEKANPIKALQFLRTSGLTGPMLNEYVFGGYLIWAAPEHKVFVDGRSDVFEWTGVLAEYKDWSLLESDSKLLLDNYHIRVCLLSRTAPMTRVLPLLPGWKKVYSDDLAVIFARPNP